MPRKLAWLLLCALSPQSLPALDLTPTHGFRDLEGFRIPVVYFRDGARKVTYQPPTDWQISGGGTSFQLFPPGRDGAAVQFRKDTLPIKGDVAEAGDIAQWFRDQLPPQATDVERIGESSGQFTLGPQPSRAVRFSYALSGHRYVAEVAVVDLDEKERLAVIVTALQADFKAVHEETVASLFHWQWEDR